MNSDDHHKSRRPGQLQPPPHPEHIAKEEEMTHDHRNDPPQRKILCLEPERKAEAQQ
jgi:hypothetical protein